jgi:putative endonuclease
VLIEVQMPRFAASMDFVYLMTNKPYGTLYVGVTNDLLRRAFEHRNRLVAGFTNEHGLHRLVWYEAHEDVTAAITREKLIKKWRRDWKVNLIQAMNPDWNDLYETIV